MTKLSKLAVFITISCAYSVGAATAQTCKGDFGGDATTSVSFGDGNQGIYTFRDDSWDVTLSDAGDGELKFDVGNSRVWLIPVDNDYDLVWTDRSRQAAVTRIRCE